MYIYICVYIYVYYTYIYICIYIYIYTATARPHKSIRNWETITSIGLTTLLSLPYSADLAPSEYHFYFLILLRIICQFFLIYGGTRFWNSLTALK